MRARVNEEFIDLAIDELKNHVKSCLKRHGDGTFASKHEAYGILAEEVQELLSAIEKNYDSDRLELEFKDVAQVCVFALACLKAKTMDW